MLTKTNLQTLIESGFKTRFGATWPGTRCGAKTRRGNRCQKPALKEKTRCQLHGGKSTGPRTAEGKARVIAANTRHGRRSGEYVARRRKVKRQLDQLHYDLKMSGLIP